MSESLILNKLIETTTSENTLEILRKQQESIKEQLKEQQLINNNLYQSLINSGILKRITSSTSANIYDSFRQNHFTNQNDYGASTTLSSLIENNHNNNNNNNLSNNGLNSLLPFNDMFNGMGSVFEKFFGSKFWIYALIALFIGITFTFFACFCIYCFCCSRLGRFFCCLKCNSFSSGSKKKEAESRKLNKCCI
jgi:hypothetical protein